MIEVTAIVLTRNRPERCLDSVWHNALSMQGLKGEIIVLNNGEEPVSIPPCISGIPCRVIQMPGNLGTTARNIGLQKAQGQYLLMLDDDSYFDPVLFENMMDAFRKPKTGAVSFRVQNDDREEGCLLPTVFHGCACAFRRSALEEVGGYPEDYLYYGEEYDLAFRLYQAGYRIDLCDGRRRVRHARDAVGRDASRIISRLVRNNTSLIFAHFPWASIGPAWRDVLQRYAYVAEKEQATEGFRDGLRGLSGALLRGLRQRRAMNHDIFEQVALVRQVREAAGRVVRAGLRDVMVCGVGKFPSLWISELQASGLKILAFRDHNSCWSGHSIHGIPVIVDGEEFPYEHSADAWLTGTSSLPENEAWESDLTLRLQAKGLDDPDRPSPAGSAAGGNIDLLQNCRINVFVKESAYFSGEKGAACELLKHVRTVPKVEARGRELVNHE